MSFTKEHLTNAITSLHDYRGRHFIPGLDWHREHVENRLPGREGYPTDIEGLKEFQAENESVSSLIRYFRMQYSPNPLFPAELAEMSLALYTAPVYLALRRGRGLTILPPTILPEVFMDTARAADGIKNVAKDISNLPLRGQRFWSPEEIYNFANGDNDDHRNYFIGRQVDPSSCPAPRTITEGVLTTMVFHPNDTINPPRERWGGHISSGGDVRDAIKFSQAFARLSYQMDEGFKISPDDTLLKGINEREMARLYEDMDTILER